MKIIPTVFSIYNHCHKLYNYVFTVLQPYWPILIPFSFSVPRGIVSQKITSKYLMIIYTSLPFSHIIGSYIPMTHCLFFLQLCYPFYGILCHIWKLCTFYAKFKIFAYSGRIDYHFLRISAELQKLSFVDKLKNPNPTSCFHTVLFQFISCSIYYVCYKYP